jgi:broad specificity phosphatase PhoE
MYVKTWPHRQLKGNQIMARLTFIAHAATEAQRRTAFPLDEPITEREVVKLSEIHWTVPRAEHVWSAPEQRTQQTARILDLQATSAEELQDCEYGRWRGRSIEAVQAEEPDGVLAWLTDPSAAPHGGESIESLIERAGRWMDEQHTVSHVIAVTHPAIIRAAIIHALRIPAQTFWRFDISPLSFTDLRFSRGLWTLRCSGCLLRTGEPVEEDKVVD